MVEAVKTFAPASVANVFVGFDILGFSFNKLGDTITLTKSDTDVTITSISGIEDQIPLQLDQNTAGKAIVSFLKDNPIDHGLNIKISKGIPLASGLGGSAASAVAAVVGVNQFLTYPLPTDKLLKYALIGEQVASGSLHGDNVTASLFGGLTAFIKKQSKYGDSLFNVIRLPIPDNLHAVVIHPGLKINTKDARQVISPEVNLNNITTNNMSLLQFIAGCYENNIEYFRDTLTDVIIEPQRKHLIPYFSEMKEIAIEKGAFGFTISGAGPTCMGLCEDKSTALSIQRSIEKFYEDIETDYTIDYWISKMNQQGATILEKKE